MKRRIAGKRLLTLALMFVLAVGLLPHIALEANAALSNSVEVEGLNYTVTVKSATSDNDERSVISEIESVQFYGAETRNANQIKITGMYLIGCMGDVDFEFEDPDCSALLYQEVIIHDNYRTAVLSITRSAASHDGGTCKKPACTRCAKTYDAPHDYKWVSSNGWHWQECKRDASHTTNHGYCSGGTAYCQRQAVCTVCHNPYGSTNPDNHKWGSWGYGGSDGDCRTCTLCEKEEKFRDHVYLTPPTCTKSEQCQNCGWYFKDSDNHNWSTTWSFNDTQHWQVCTRSDEHVRNRDNHSGDSSANCTKAGTCTTCGTTYHTDSHSYTYSASDNIITETCANGCAHSATAELKVSDGTYTGAAITTAIVEYTGGWKGGDLEIAYQNNTAVSTTESKASCTITKNGATATAGFTINKVDISGDEITVELTPPGVTYNGQDQTPNVAVHFNGTLLVKDTDYTAEWFGDLTNAGKHKLLVTGKGNFDGFEYLDYEIAKATLTNVNVQNPDLTYNGTAQQPTVIANATTVDGSAAQFAYGTVEGTYGTMPTFTEAGTYTVYYKVSAASHYDANGSFTVSVKRADNEWTAGPAINGWSYGQTANTPEYGAKFGTVGVVYSGMANDGEAYSGTTLPTKAGDYTAEFTVEGTANYTGLSQTVLFTVARADYDVSAAKWNYTKAFKYDGTQRKVEIVGLPDGVTVTGYTGNIATAAGSYIAKVNLAYDGDNYNEPVVADLKWRIQSPVIVTKQKDGAPNTGDNSGLLLWPVLLLTSGSLWLTMTALCKKKHWL